MKKTLFGILIIAILSYILISYKYTDNNLYSLGKDLDTVGMLNGRAWNIIDSYEIKSEYVRGIAEGYMAFSMNATIWADDENVHRDCAIGLMQYFQNLMPYVEYIDQIDIINQIDKVYQDKDNLDIPIAMVYTIAIMNLGGIDNKYIEEHLLIIRDLSNRLVEDWR